MLPRVKSMLQQYASPPQRRRFRDQPRAAPKKTEASPIRLVGYFVGGILLANLVLTASAMFRSDDSSSPAVQRGAIQNRGSSAAAERMAQSNATSGVGVPDAQVTAEQEISPTFEKADREISVTDMCLAQARDKLTDALNYYYLQRGRRPAAPVDQVNTSAEMSTLFAGPGDPTLASGRTCES